MLARRATRRHETGAAGSDAGREWIGGRFTPPFFITDREEPYRVTLALWMELPEGLIVGQRVAPPEESDGAVGRALVAAMHAPLVGPPRRPARMRVTDPTLAAEVRAVAGDAVPVAVAPMPEPDECLEHMNGRVDARRGAAGELPRGRTRPTIGRRRSLRGGRAALPHRAADARIDLGDSRRTS